MKTYIYSILNNLNVAISFILATKIGEHNIVYGAIGFAIAFMLLDYHSYIDKKLGYPNNIFIR